MSTRKIRSEIQNMAKKPTVGKQPVPEPASFRQFFLLLVMHVCKKVLLVRTSVKVGIYMLCASALSLVADLIHFPQSYFSDKGNFFNQYFVKLGWGWTLSILLPFVYYTSTIYCCGKKPLVRQHMSRLAIATFWWYTCTSMFRWIENATGICSSAEMDHYNKKTCKDAGHDWIGFDISGHAFLLIHCLLVISEEVRCIDGWNKITEFIKSEEEHPARLSNENLSILKSLYEIHTPKVKGFIVILTLLQLLWEVMMLATVIYFHNMPQKVMGAGFAAAVWMLTYQSWYKLEVVMPVSPGVGLFRYQSFNTKS